jgi:hypothetical protein
MKRRTATRRHPRFAASAPSWRTWRTLSSTPAPRPRRGESASGIELGKTKTTRADIVQALADSFAFCDPAFANLTDQSATELVRQGQNEVARGSVLANLIAHGNEEYGIMTVYIRMKGMVPPSTERGMRGREQRQRNSCGRCNEERKTKSE